jgi:hypothetical protein
MCIIYLMSITTFQCLAQKSVFEQDTVSFRYYETGNNDELISRVYKKNIYRDEIDTIRNWRYVFIDKNKTVHWNELPTGNNNYLYRMFIQAGINDTSIHNLPPFKVVRQGLLFTYQTIEKRPKILFRGSFSLRNGIKKAPFFLAWSISRGVPWEDEYENMSYVKDTVLKISGRGIPCHLFSKFKANMPKYSGSFYDGFTEIYFEKASLLPILISRRTIGRTYVTDSNDDGTPIGFVVGYSQSKIEPRW